MRSKIFQLLFPHAADPGGPGAAERFFAPIELHRKGPVRASDATLLELEKILADKHQITHFDEAFTDGRSLVLRSDDIVIHLRNKPVEIATYSGVNPLIDSGVAGSRNPDTLYYTISKFILSPLPKPHITLQ